MKYAICFDFAEGQPVYAGMTHDNSFGFAPTLDTAAFYPDEETAERVLKNAYGKLGEYGSVIEVPS